MSLKTRGHNLKGVRERFLGERFTWMRADERLFSGVSSFVDFEVLASGENLAAIVAAEWFLASVDSHVIDKLVLRLEWCSKAWAVVPEAEVLAIWGFDHVLVDDVLDEFAHGVPFETAFSAVLDPVALVHGVLDFAILVLVCHSCELHFGSIAVGRVAGPLGNRNSFLHGTSSHGIIGGF